MVICANCKKEMKCKKTGSNVHYRNGTHVYPGDQFECAGCGAVVNVTIANAHYNAHPVKLDTDVWMDD